MLGIRALKILEKALVPDHTKLLYVLDDLGKIYIQKEHFSQAESHLERALRICAKASCNSDSLAAVKFSLARAKWRHGRERSRAQELALQARELYAGRKYRKKQVAQIDAWLSKHQTSHH